MAVSFSTVYQQRDFAIDQFQATGEIAPVANFLAQYGKYLPGSQLNRLVGETIGSEQLTGETREDFIDRSIGESLGQAEGEGISRVDSLVQAFDIEGNLIPGMIRSIRSYLEQGEGLGAIQGNVEDITGEWDTEYEGEQGSAGPDVGGWRIVAPIFNLS